MVFNDDDHNDWYAVSSGDFKAGSCANRGIFVEEVAD